MIKLICSGDNGLSLALVEAGGSLRLELGTNVLAGWPATPAELFALSCATPGAHEANRADNMIVTRYLFFI